MSTLTAVDLFAGLGGNTEGAKQAGVEVIAAANHWPEAVNFHRLNHPEAEHYLQDLQQANFHEWPDFDVMMASPECQGHSDARGSEKPHHDNSRSTAWACVACAEAKRPKFLMIENVPEFTRWALFPEWSRCLEKLGYTLSRAVIDAADLGVPQHRERLMLVGVHERVSAEPVAVPAPGLPHTPARTIIRWEEGNWSPVLKDGRSPATLQRWMNGRLEHGPRFVMPYYSSGSGKTGRSLDRPIGTITTRDRWAVVDNGRMRMLSRFEARDAMGFPAHYRLPDVHATALKLLGNAVAPAVAKHVLEAIKQHASKILRSCY